MALVSWNRGTWTRCEGPVGGGGRHTIQSDSSARGRVGLLRDECVCVWGGNLLTKGLISRDDQPGPNPEDYRVQPGPTPEDSG